MKIPGTVLQSFLAIALVNPSLMASTRTELTSKQLLASPAIIDFVDNQAYLPAADATDAKHSFSGLLVIPDHPMSSVPTEIRPAEIQGKKTQLFPGVSLAFVSYKGHLVPLDRELLTPKQSDSYWQLQVSPGRVWTEEADHGKSRASFPFLLTSIIENESYNGVATFLYDDDSVSQLRYQIVQQLAPFVIETPFVATGQTEVALRLDSADQTAVTADFDRELANQLPWRDWSELEEEYGQSLLADFDSGIDPALTLTSGLVIDGHVYVRSMNTPYGPYPYPRQMRHGVWSVTKTAAGLLTLMRMAQKYGYEILDYKISDLLEVTADHDGWESVTLRNVFSMATGIGTGSLDVSPNMIESGDASNPENNAGVDDYMTWYFKPSRKEKLYEVFKVPSYPWGPGEYARYRDRDIFTGSAALEALLKAKEGPEADLWQMMVNEVYRQIGINHISITRTRETEGLGTPILAWGIYLSIDDAVRIATLIQNGGKYEGMQLLSKLGVAEAMYETDIRGLSTGHSNIHGANTYHLTLWHENFVTSSGKSYTVPRMVGYGGNIIQLMPNGMIGFRFGRGGEVPLEQMTIIANAIRPFDEYTRLSKQRTK